MDPDLPETLSLLRIAAGTFGVIIGISAGLLVLAPLPLYLIARWRHRDDPQLGFKVALHFFATAGLQLALLGAALLLATILSPGAAAQKGTAYRAAFAMLVPAGLVIGAHVAALQRTNDAQHPGVRRLFAGFNLVLSGVIGFVGLVLAFQALFAKGSTHGLGHDAAAISIVYGIGWIGSGWRVARQLAVLPVVPDLVAPPRPRSRTAPEDGRATPAAGLPKLGGGSYPPIDSPR